jgi:hypothetical protein
MARNDSFTTKRLEPKSGNLHVNKVTAFGLSVGCIVLAVTLQSCNGFATLELCPHLKQSLLPWRRIVHCPRLWNLAMMDDSQSDGMERRNDDDERRSQRKVEQERDRLEDLNTRAFLKRRVRKLPYEAARKWVQANLGANSQEEFLDLVENGNLRTPYIPKRSDVYYTETREWISWDHFLSGIFDDEQPSAVRPQTGVFD